MREIKFRAWFDSHKLMGQVVTLKGSNRTNYDANMWDEVTAECFIEGRQQFFSSYNFKLLQYTGLKDKNGKEIYEGDVIQYKSYDAYRRWWSKVEEIPEIEKEQQKQRDEYRIEKDSVKYRDGSFVVNYAVSLDDVARGYRLKNSQSGHADCESKQWDFEVIGNIYENPELLSNPL